MQNNITIRCLAIQSFNQNEIMDMIDGETLMKIKEKDSRPYFQLYSLAHEGVSEPKIIGEKSSPISWPKKAIQSIKNVIKKGIKFFMGHNEDNSTDNRRELGEVVGGSEREIDGKLHSLIVGYFPPATKEEVKGYDICSQEAIWNFVEDSGQMIADSIYKLTGIALGNSKEDKPAFLGAKRLGVLQAFKDGKSDDPIGDIGYKKEEKQMTFNDVKNAVKELNVFPSQLYSLDEIKKDREFGSVLTELEIIKNKMVEREKEWSKVKSDLETQLSSAVKEKDTITAKQRLNDMVSKDDLKLTDNQRKFLLDNFNEQTDVSDKGLQDYITKQIDVFQKVASVITPGQNTPIKTGDGKEKTEADPTKAENNPLLKQDYEEII